jgi:mannose-6-phosphate isomerase-like protein (cupin superfamily)
MFFVIKGEFNMEFRDKIVTIKEGEFIIEPSGVEHKPMAENEVEIAISFSQMLLG